MLALALLLSQAPPSKAYVNVENNGADAGFMRVFNITSGGSCTVNQLTNVATCTFSGGGGGAAPGGSKGQAQFNAGDGGFGGMSNFVSLDGRNPTFLPIAANPSAPDAGRTVYDIGWTPGMPEFPHELDNFFGVPNWAGMTPPYSGLGTQGSWQLVCHLPDQYGGGNLSTLYGTQTVLQPFSSTTGFSFDAGSLMGRLRWAVGATGASGPNVWSTMRETLGSLWVGVGGVSGSGGFKAWERIATLTETTNPTDGGNPDSSAYFFAGWTLCGTAFTNTSDSSALQDTIYFGCDSANADIHACSNDRVGNATCTDLGANFPCRSGSGGTTGPYGYDAFFYQTPSVPGAVGYFIVSIDRAVSATGTLTDLPTPQSGYLCYYAARNSGHDAGSTSGGSIGVGGECVWQHL